MHRVDCGVPALLEFRGPDVLRFLNGQLSQDVRLVAGGENCLPSCVTDAKGRLQFRVWLSGTGDGGLWVDGPGGQAEELEARLTRYLIADEVEVFDRTGLWSLMHFTGVPEVVPAGVRARLSARFGVSGVDWWIPAGLEPGFPAEADLLGGDALEAFRIRHGVPAWGRELVAGLLPPEAGLDATDISYQKGCYIGQEVISRIKSAGKVNQRLRRMLVDAAFPGERAGLFNADRKLAGELTSISPVVEENGVRLALGYVKRGIDEVFSESPDGVLHPVRIL